MLVQHVSTSMAHAIVVLETPIGFRGWNEHTGDQLSWSCPNCKGSGTQETIDGLCPNCGNEVVVTYLPFPGIVLTLGKIAQGDAGRMGDGAQMVALIPKGTVFRIKAGGNNYCEEVWYTFDGLSIQSATTDERIAFDQF